jgi:alkylation response protein AidB-like acyl-CoA dehydrogenase
MQFNVSAEQKPLADRILALCRCHLDPDAVSKMDAESAYPESLHRAMADAGLLGHCLPSATGGGDGRMIDAVLIQRILGAHSDAAVNILFVNYLCAALVGMAGTDSQKQAILPGVVAGRIRLAFALTEPDAGSDANALQCRAEASGDGFILNGTKFYTTGAAQADFILTVALTDPEGRLKLGASLFLVPTGSKGLEMEALPKLAGNAVPSCRVGYNNVRLAGDALLGPKNGAWQSVMMGAGLERTLVAGACLGRAEAVLADVIDFVNERHQFGQPVGRFQAIQHQVADMATDIEAMACMVNSAAARIDAGELPIKQISMAKLFCAERLNEIANRGMRLLGGRAYLNSWAMQRHLRESFLGLYAGGTAEIQRNLIAGQLGLGRDQSA